MDTTSNRHSGGSPASPDRTGATWVAGTGAFLLLAAAALFVAVRWDDLPDAAKLGVVGALTGAFLLGGRALGRTLPATGDVLFHLGALLIPIDVAAVSVRLGLGWRGLLLAEGLAAGAALTALAAASDSVVLAWVATAAPVAVAAGVAAVSPVPAPLLLAIAAVGAAVAAAGTAGGAGSGAPVAAAEMGGAARSGTRSGGVWTRAAIGWAALAGLAPMLGVVVVGLLRPGGHAGIGVLTELGLAGRVAGWAAVASGLLAAGVLGREARTRADGALAGLAVAVLVAGVITAGVAADLSRQATELALPGLFVAVEAGALLARRDRFWAPVAARAAFLAEVPAVVFGWTFALWGSALAPMVNNFVFFGDGFEPRPALGVSLGLLAVAWFLMGARNRFSGPDDAAAGGDPSLWRSVLAAAGEYPWLIAPAVVAAVAYGTVSGPATAAAMVVLAALLAVAPQRGARLTAGVLALWAPVTTFADPWTAASAGLAGAAVVTLAARRAASRGGTGAARVDGLLLTLAAVGAAMLVWVTAGPGNAAFVGSLLAVGACVAIASALEPDPLLPFLGRAGAVLTAGAVAAADPGRALPALALATVLALAEAVGRDRPVVALGAAATVQLVVVDLARRGGLDTAATGLALCVAAVVWAGLMLVTDERWRLPLLAAAGTGLAAGAMLAGQEPRAGAHALLIVGGVVAAAGVALRRPGAVGAGAAIVCLAIGSHLELSHVRATDAYLAPVAALLAGAGFHLRRAGASTSRPASGATPGDPGPGGPARASAVAGDVGPLLADRPPSSWVAYAPAIVLMGGAALVERIAGGGGVHALVAGAVGMAAVAVGGGRRLAGPLVTGTAVLVAVTVHESLGTLATVPTWGWLAAGGSVLLATGVALERRGGAGPFEAGRRLVDVVGERFS
ncbi:MAG: hypothetical protein QOF96_3833 [Actinomycetota bacterium]|nr:hypothetical protein [Actinomycetota bacterium]